MKTIRAILHGGRHDGTPLDVDGEARRVTIISDDLTQSHYRRSEDRDRRNRQVFRLEHNNALGLKPCDL